jgi:general secretion pathway protein B
MSLLLDALNKADQERKRNEASPGIHSNHGHTGDHHSRTMSIAVIAAIVIGLGILLAVIYWLGQRSTAPVASAATSSIAATAPKVNQTSVPSNVVHNNPAAKVPVNTEQATATPEQDVASLYAQNTQAAEPTVTAPAAETIAIAPNNYAPDNNALSNNSSTEPAATTPNSINQFANLPNLHDLPNQILVKIPSLNYSEHNYNSNGGSVKINGEIKHINDQLATGLVIDKILEDGMILHLDNYSFKMRALNSWVNM